MLVCGPGVHAAPMVAPSQRISSLSEQVATFVDEAAKRFAVPAAWIRAVMEVESNGKIHALSHMGAIGLMQIMPRTWAGLRARYSLGDDPFDAHDNIVAGSAYLRDLWDRYGAPEFLAAYNAGPRRYEEHLATRRPLPTETLAYLAKLTPALTSDAIDGVMGDASVVGSWAEAPLFIDHLADNSTPSDPHRMPSAGISADDHPAAFAAHSDGLFVATRDQTFRP